MKVVVSGSRDWDDRFLSEHSLEQAGLVGRTLDWLNPSLLIHGCARGVDTLAGEWAAYRGCPVEEHPADWSQGRGAGFARNIRMLLTQPDLVVAFWDGESRGTKHTIDNALSMKLNTMVVFPKSR